MGRKATGRKRNKRIIVMATEQEINAVKQAATFRKKPLGPWLLELGIAEYQNDNRVVSLLANVPLAER